jgi:hypothetical protein
MVGHKLSEGLDMNARRKLILASLLTLSCKTGNGESDDDPIDPAIAAQVDLCQEVCIKPFCDPTLEPAPGVEEECRAGCIEMVESAQSSGCTDQYQDFLECLDPLSCDDFYLWLNAAPDAPCTQAQAELESSCPEVGAS